MTRVARLAARTLLASFDGPVLPEWARHRLAEGMGGICLYGTNAVSRAAIRGLCATIHEAAAGAITALDEEGGDVTRLYYREGSPYAGPAVLGAVDDLALTQAVSADIGSELRALGVDLDLAPVADVNSKPRNPVIGVRSFGADADVVARHTVAWVRGVQAAGAGACLKHFPGHGDTVVDSHVGLPVVESPVEVLRERELVPFQAAVDAGAVAVMTSHVVVHALDPSRPATFSSAATHLLRAPLEEGGLGFSGLLVSDALDMQGASGGIGVPEAAVRALATGVDLLCLGTVFTDERVQAVIDAVIRAVSAGVLPQQRLEDAAARVDAASQRLAVLRRDANTATDQSPGSSSEIAARRAISVVGQLTSVTGAQVVRLMTDGNQAAGHAPWGLPANGAVLAGRPALEVAEGDPLPSLDASRPLVVLVRGAQRYAWAFDAVSTLAAANPEAVVVELGWPGPDPLPGRAVVHTLGASAVSMAALDRLLADGGP